MAELRPPPFAFPTPYLRLLAEQVQQAGGDVAGWLAGVQLTPTALHGAHAALTPDAFAALVADALERTREPALGLLVGERLAASSHGVVGHAALHSGTLRQALDVLARYVALRMPLLSLRTDLDDGACRLRFELVHPLGALERPLLEAMLLALHQLLSALTLGRSPVREVALPFALGPDRALADALFGVPLRERQPWAGLVLDADLLDAPLTLADPEAFAVAERLCRAQLDEREAADALAPKLNRLLRGRGAGFPTLTVCARLLHMSPRTLHRHLLDEGTSYRALLDAARSERAIEYLSEGGLSVEDTAWALGYGDVANFRRAFRRWTGRAPSELRCRPAPTAPPP